MRPTRRTQPFRRGAGRVPTGALAAALAGRPAVGRNPADAQRQFAKGGGLAARLTKLALAQQPRGRRRRRA